MKYICDANDDDDAEDADDADADDADADDDADANDANNANDADADDIFHASGPFTMHSMCINTLRSMLKQAPRRMQNLPMGNQHHHKHIRGGQNHLPKEYREEVLLHK